jgi:hypothetical protein
VLLAKERGCSECDGGAESNQQNPLQKTILVKSKKAGRLEFRALSYVRFIEN